MRRHRFSRTHLQVVRAGDAGGSVTGRRAALVSDREPAHPRRVVTATENGATLIESHMRASNDKSLLQYVAAE